MQLCLISYCRQQSYSVSSFTAEYDCFTKGLIAAYCMVEMLNQVKHAIYVITESSN